MPGDLHFFNLVGNGSGPRPSRWKFWRGFAEVVLVIFVILPVALALLIGGLIWLVRAIL